MTSMAIVADPYIHRELGVPNRIEVRRFARQVAGPGIWSEFVGA
jgi:hypothetical protein